MPVQTLKQKQQAQDKERQAYAFFTSKGWKPHQAIGIVGNLKHESNLNTTILGTADNKGSRAIAQWHGDRLKTLKSKYGDKWTDFNNQLEFVDWELNNTEKSAGDKLRNSKGVWEAGRIVSDDYERPKVKFIGDETRQRHVSNLAMKFKGIKLTPEDMPYYGVTYANSVAPYLNQPTPTINYLQIPQQSPTFASAPTPEKDESQDETDVEVQKVEQESNFLREIEKEDYAHLQPQQKMQEETPQTDYMQQYEQIGQFLGNSNEVAQQGKKFQLKDERNLVQKDATQVNTQKFRTLKQLNVRNKTNKEIAQEREAKIQASIEARKVPYTKENWRQQLAAETVATGDKFRVSNEPNFFDDYVNPAVMIGSMASSLGQAPLQAQQSDSVMPYVTAIGAPLAVGALAGLGTQNTGQFINNLANPLAGTGDLVNSLGNKYLPNVYKLNPKAFKPNPESYYRMIGDEGLADLQNVGYVRSNPNTFYKDKHPFFSKSYPIDGRIGKSVVKDSKYLGNNMIEVGGNNEIGNRFVKNRWADAAPDSNIFVARDKIGIDNPNLKVYEKDWLKGYKQIEVPSDVSPILTNTSKNLEDLNYAKEWAKQYGYELPENLERIAQSDELTNRTIRGLMDRHNTFVRGVSTNWDEIEKRNPEILRHLEGKGIDWKNNPKQAAEYMSTHVPIQTGYGRASLDKEVFKRGQDAIYTSNSIPTAEGYTYGQGYITKVKKPTDFTSTNRQDWINVNNPKYTDEDLFRANLPNFKTDEVEMFTNAVFGKDFHTPSMNVEGKLQAVRKRIETAKRQLDSSSPDYERTIKQMEDDYEEVVKHSNELGNSKYDNKLLRTERRDFDNITLQKDLPFIFQSHPEAKLKFGEFIKSNNLTNEVLNSKQGDVWLKNFISENNYMPNSKYAHYLHLGTPGEKILEPVKSWEITPDIWKNKSRAHTNEYSKKLSALSALPIAGASYLATQGQEKPKKLQQGGQQNLTENEIAFLSEIAIKDQEGQRNHPNKVIEIQGNTMSTHGYGDIPLYIIPNKGKARVIEANTGQHKFKGATKFLEIPIKNA